MNASIQPTFSGRGASFRTSPPAVTRMKQPVAMPAWHSQTLPTRCEAECVVILIGLTRRAAGEPAAPERCMHAYGRRGASALCGASNWRELVPPAETTCPACAARLGRSTTLRVH